MPFDRPTPPAALSFAVSSADAFEKAIIEKRMALSGPSGFKGLVHNRRVFGIAVFASLGGLLYGYNQGVFSGVLTMTNFLATVPDAKNATLKGWLTAILELGAWLGTLLTGYTCDKLGRKRCILLAVIIFCIGVIVQTTTHDGGGSNGASFIYAGRFITGMGVGSLSMGVPIYNAEVAPPEVRGSLVALQQLAITFGIMVSFWIDYGCNYIGGTGTTQSDAAWRLPLALQLVPAIVLFVGMLFMPSSPRYLMNIGKETDALAVLSHLRGLPEDDELVRMEWLQVKSQYLFDKETSQQRYPHYQDGSFKSDVLLGLHGYLSLLTNRSMLIRISTACLIMFFQQWTGVNAVLYYAPTIFTGLGLTGNTISLLATGVVGIVMFLATIPTVIWVDRVGRRSILIWGAFGMASCHLIIAVLSGLYEDSWPSHGAAGWAACVMVWLFAIHFGYSWGPVAWVTVAEIWPLSLRAKGVSIGASSNWMNNFIVGQVTPNMLKHLRFGTYVFFGVLTFLGALYVIVFVPETKGLTLEEMDIIFGDTSGTAITDRERQNRINKEIGLEAIALGQTRATKMVEAEHVGVVGETADEKEKETNGQEEA